MESILSQTLTDWELIVCDSYSDDGTWEYFQQFKTDPRVRLYQVPREGLYAGWNECLRRVTGEYVYIATADDTCKAECLQKLVGALDRAKTLECKEEQRNEDAAPDGRRLTREEKGVESEERLSVVEQSISVERRAMNDERLLPIDIAVCDFETIDAAGALIEHPAAHWPRLFFGEWITQSHIRDGRTTFLLHATLGLIWWTVTAILFRRSLLGRIGFFRTDRGSQADEEWEMRACLVSDMFFVPEKLATWRVHPEQATSALASGHRINLDSLEAVLNDAGAGIPEAWKQIRNWREEIIYICKVNYLDSFTLYGNIARRSPARFLRGVFSALFHEPGFLFRQFFRGFAWDPKLSPDPIDAAHHLIRLFDCTWPPRNNIRS